MNTADPLFMAGAVAVGMFGNPALAGVIMASHYLAALGTGLVLRWHRAGERSPDPAVDRRPLLVRATDALIAAHQRDGRPLGQLLGEAVRDSVQTLLLVGGFIILFAVLLDILARAGVVAWAGLALGTLLHPLGIGPAAARSLVGGLFEITIGTKAASVAPAPLLQRVVLCSIIIAWSGLSVMAQVAAVTQGTGMRMGPYVRARVLQAVLAAALTFWLWNPTWAHRGRTVAVATSAIAGGGVGRWAERLPFSTTIGDASLILSALLAVAAIGVLLTARRQGCRIAWLRVAPAFTNRGHGVRRPSPRRPPR